MLRKRMAEFGFESNEDYEYRVRCLLGYRPSGLRACVVEGESERRKTAFANALARALDWGHVLYHDFSEPEDPPPPFEPSDEDGEPMIPLTRFDRAMSEACALSEAESTILILDQLHCAEFKQHLRLYHFVTTCEWTYPLATLRANPRRFLLFLISAAPLYHSLAKESFRIWSDTGRAALSISAEALGLEADAEGLLAAMQQLFATLGVLPTESEYRRVVEDCLRHARTVDQLRQTLFAWIEGLAFDALFESSLDPQLQLIVDEVLAYNGCDVIEL